MNQRALAATALQRISRDGAYSNVVLPHITADLVPQERALVTRLVHGALRNVRRLDWMIEEMSGRKVDRLDAEVRAVLEVALAEIGSSPGGAIHATVNESVEAVKQLGRGRAAAFVNALLRRVAREGLPAVPDDPEFRYSVPRWVVDRLAEDHGAGEAARLLAGLRKEAPPTPLRCRAGAGAPEGARRVAGIEGAYYIAGAVRPQPGLVFTDAASTAVGLAVGPEPGMRVLDMAAAPGGKTMHLVDQTRGSAYVVAMDVHDRRLRSAKRRLAKEGVEARWVTGDARTAPFRSGVFDAVLVDAPCTGLGTLRRRPEIAMRLDERAPERLGEIQRGILAEAWRVTRPGGRIVYSVCTVFAGETTEVVADYPGAAPRNLPGRPWGRGLLLAPHLTETDGMFISVITR